MSTFSDFMAGLPLLRRPRYSETTIVGYIGMPGMSFRYGGGVEIYDYSRADRLISDFGCGGWEWEDLPVGGAEVWGQRGDPRLLVLDRKGKYVWAFSGVSPVLMRRARPADVVLPRTNVARGMTVGKFVFPDYIQLRGV